MYRRIPPPRKPAPAQRSEPVLLAQLEQPEPEPPPQPAPQAFTVTEQTRLLMARIKAQAQAQPGASPLTIMDALK